MSISSDTQYAMSITAGSAEGVAQSLADAEGLTLIRACNQSGYRYVSVDPRKLHVNTGSLSRSPYRARSTGQHKFNLGEFATAHEAALAVARFFGPQLSRDQAAATRIGSRRGRESEFGVPKKRRLDAAYCVDTYHPLAYCTYQGTGQLAPGPHAMYARVPASGVTYVPRTVAPQVAYDQAATVAECIETTVIEAETSEGDGSVGSGSGAPTAILAEVAAEVVAITVSAPGGSTNPLASGAAAVAAAALMQEGVRDGYGSDGTASRLTQKRPAVRPSRATSTAWTTRHERPAVTVVDGVAYFAVEVPRGVRAPACLTVEWAS